MARPRSDEKRGAIMAAATRVIAAEGLGAATAAIAQEAGVSNGSLFTYFETKTELFNAFNHSEFTNPGTAVNAASFGVISSTTVAARIIQFALKYSF